MQGGFGGWEAGRSISPKPQPAILLTDKACESRWQGNTSIFLMYRVDTTNEPPWRYLVLFFSFIFLCLMI